MRRGLVLPVLTTVWFLVLVAVVQGRRARKVVLAVDGGTESIRAACFDATGHMVGCVGSAPYETHHPHPGWAEQDPESWWQSLRVAVRNVLDSLVNEDEDDYEVCGMCIDTTCCSVVALDSDKQSVKPCVLWMDQRSAPQAAKIMELAYGDPALIVNCQGKGPVSAEWMTPKALWIKENWEWDRIEHICEYQDYMNYKLTSVFCANACNAATRWHWDGNEAIRGYGRPLSLYRKIGIPELTGKLPSLCLPMGAVVGLMTEQAASHLGLPRDLPVVQGGPDAFVGMVGLGCINVGQMCLITGSSHLHCVVAETGRTAPGIWGAYRGAPLPQLYFAEGGQSSTGSILRWAKTRLFGGEMVSYKDLDAEASVIAPGADGLICLETFQGSRTPITDPLAKGALVGLTLSHTRGHIWRALLEGVCFGTRACVKGLEAAGHPCNEIVLAGGVTRSELWLQMHADITNKTISVCDHSENAPLLGCAILASVGVGLHETVPDAVKAMVRIRQRIHPQPKTAKAYDAVYRTVYSRMADTVRPVVHALDSLRGGSAADDTEVKAAIPAQVIISPSLLACDWADIRGEVRRCMEAGLKRLHVDIFDGVYLESPNAFTFGPKMVQAIRTSCDASVTLDLHVCVHQPSRFVEPMAAAGADCFIFQIEATKDPDEAIQLAEMIVEAGMGCGVSINPSTPVDRVIPLLESGLIQTVDVLAVEPGFGGQTFQQIVLSKVRALRQWRESNGHTFDIMVDGGVNVETVRSILDAGTDVLVAGSFLFGHPQGLHFGARRLLAARELS